MTREIDIPPQFAAHKSVYPRSVVWGDLDAMQHVNNTKYFYYCESARFAFMQTLQPDVDMTNPAALEVGFALAETACKFKVSLTFPDQLLIATEVSSIAGNEVWLKHLIYSQKMDLIATEAKARLVNFDYRHGKRAPLSNDVLSALKEHMLS